MVLATSRLPPMVVPLALFAVLALLAACGSEAYDPDPQTPLGLAAGQARTLGCVDLAVALGSDPRLPPSSLLLSLRGGNRCAHPEPLDVAAMSLVGRDARGARWLLFVSDPRGEIVPMHLDASTRFTENIELASNAPADALVSVCIQLAGVARDAPDARPEPICFRRTAEGWSQ
jgi:hypothetical protein